MASLDAALHEPCSVSELTAVLAMDGPMMLPSRALDQVYPGVFVGEQGAAKDINLLKNYGITHVLNTAHGTTPYHCQNNEDLYNNTGISYTCIDANDSEDFPICMHFDGCSEMINNTVNSGGKILVHCKVGASRSATIVLAFLVIKRGMRVMEAVKTVREKREICPNEGFLKQLCDLDERLLKQGHFVKWS